MNPKAIIIISSIFICGLFTGCLSTPVLEIPVKQDAEIHTLQKCESQYQVSEITLDLPKKPELNLPPIAFPEPEPAGLDDTVKGPPRLDNFNYSNKDLPLPEIPLPVKQEEIKLVSKAKDVSIDNSIKQAQSHKNVPEIVTEQKKQAPGELLHREVTPLEVKETKGTQIKTSEVFATLGDDIEISFNSPGWIFMGFTNADDKRDIIFQKTEVRSGETVFKFKAKKTGSFRLPFERQENSNGTKTEQVVILKVVEQKKIEAILKDNQGAGEEQEPIDLSYANKLYAIGQYDKALEKYLNRYRDDNPFLNQRIAAIYFDKKDYDKACNYWQRNIYQEGLYHAEAILGLIKLAVLKEDEEAVFTYLKPLLTLQDISIQPELLMLAQYFNKNKNTVMVMDLLDEYLKRYPDGELLDRVYFLYAQVYETDSAVRDFRTAKEYYKRIADNFPASTLYEQAYSRIEYIDRHYLYIR